MMFTNFSNNYHEGIDFEQAKVGFMYCQANFNESYAFVFGV